MDRLTLIVVSILCAIFAFFLGAILFSFLSSKPDLPADDLLAQLQRKQGGEIRAILPGRKMLEIATPTGDALIGYWQQKDVGEQMLQPYLTVRWRPHQPLDLPDFLLLEAKPLTAALNVHGYKKAREKITIQSQKFWLFVKSSSPSLNLDDLQRAIQLATTPRISLADTAPMAEIN